MSVKGMTSGRLTAVKEVVENGLVRWLCRCECGGSIVLPAHRIRNRGLRSCGCARNPGDLAGNKYGMLTALHKGRDEQGRPGYLCRCECGTERVILTQRLNTGSAKSCGCRGRGRTGPRPIAAGARFGLLTLVADHYTPGNGATATVTCNCDCGTSGIRLLRSKVVYGFTRHCGCLKRPYGAK